MHHLLVTFEAAVGTNAAFQPDMNESTRKNYREPQQALTKLECSNTLNI